MRCATAATRHPEGSEAESKDPAASAAGNATASLDCTRHDRRFRRALAKWFQKNKRDLPWRHTRDPYAILVSEVMLQQTVVATVVPYYNRWLRRFPSLHSLAHAAESEVLHAWQGLGYYSRARNLHRCAQISIACFGGSLPTSATQLRSLPGIGHYTANAIAVFAFDQALPIVEANTARVLSRVFNIRDSIDSHVGRVKLWDASARLIPKSAARDFQSAMMDLGALICSPRQPRCDICPIRKLCAAPDPASLPIKRNRHPIISLVESHASIRRRNEVLLEQCRARWRGMWMLPSIRLPRRAPIYSARFPFTHHQIMLRVFPAEARRQRPGERWFPIAQLEHIPIPSPHRRAIETILGTTGHPEQRDSSTSLEMTFTMRA
jgi:A/G-specific adenine glycosylase